MLLYHTTIVSCIGGREVKAISDVVVHICCYWRSRISVVVVDGNRRALLHTAIEDPSRGRRKDRGPHMGSYYGSGGGGSSHETLATARHTALRCQPQLVLDTFRALNAL